MKTLKDHTIIYDDECPMCNLYTSAFVKTGMLDAQGREPFSSFSRKGTVPIDLSRANDEIALVNRKNHTITYGLNSLFLIIGNSIPLFKPLFRQRIFHRIMKPIYFLVSYNRKVIVPGQEFEGRNACTPTFNIKYRVAYIIFAWLITSIILAQYASMLAPIVPETDFSREFIICGGQLLFQGLLVATVFKGRLLHYLGNLMTISLGGALLLLPMIFISDLVLSPLIFLLYFLFVVSGMLFEHVQRVKMLELPWFVSAGWVVYRIIVLFIIL